MQVQRLADPLCHTKSTSCYDQLRADLSWLVTKRRLASHSIAPNMEKPEPGSLFAQCLNYLTQGVGDGRNLAVAIKHEGSLEAGEAAELLDASLVCSRQHADNIAAALLTTGPGAETAAMKLLEKPTNTFNAVWHAGISTFRALILHVVLNKKAWKSDDERAKAEKGVFTLLLAKLLEAGVDHPELALFGVARLLAQDWKALAPEVDSDAYAELFSYLDSDEKEETRSQATLALAKLFDVAAERTERELHAFTKTQVESRRADKIGLACFAVATLFPVMTAVTSKIVLQEGFLQILTSLVDSKRSSKLRLSAIELLSAGCMDGACRKAIRENCDGWAWKAFEDHKHDNNTREGAAAAVLVAKLRAEPQEGASADNRELVEMLKGLTTSEKTFEQAVEALSYQSTQPALKKAIAEDSALLKR